MRAAAGERASVGGEGKGVGDDGREDDGNDGGDEDDDEPGAGGGPPWQEHFDSVVGYLEGGRLRRRRGEGAGVRQER